MSGAAGPAAGGLAAAACKCAFADAGASRRGLRRRPEDAERRPPGQPRRRKPPAVNLARGARTNAAVILRVSAYSRPAGARSQVVITRESSRQAVVWPAPPAKYLPGPALQAVAHVALGFLRDSGSKWYLVIRCATPQFGAVRQMREVPAGRSDDLQQLLRERFQIGEQRTCSSTSADRFCASSRSR